MSNAAASSCHFPPCLGADGKCDPSGFWSPAVPYTFLALTVASALAAVGTFFFVLLSKLQLPQAFALPVGLGALSGVCFLAFKIFLYRNAHRVGEQFQICGYDIACLSDTSLSEKSRNGYTSSPPICG